MGVLYASYYKLVPFSFALQHALANQTVDLANFVLVCHECASSVVGIVCDVLGPRGFLRYATGTPLHRHGLDDLGRSDPRLRGLCGTLPAQGTLVAMSTPLIAQLIRPRSSAYADEERVLAQVTRLAETLTNAAVDAQHTPALYGSFLRAVIEARKEAAARSRAATREGTPVNGLGSAPNGAAGPSGPLPVDPILVNPIEPDPPAHIENALASETFWDSMLLRASWHRSRTSLTWLQRVLAARSAVSAHRAVILRSTRRPGATLASRRSSTAPAPGRPRTSALSIRRPSVSFTWVTSASVFYPVHSYASTLSVHALQRRSSEIGSCSLSRSLALALPDAPLLLKLCRCDRRPRPRLAAEANYCRALALSSCRDRRCMADVERLSAKSNRNQRLKHRHANERRREQRAHLQPPPTPSAWDEALVAAQTSEAMTAALWGGRGELAGAEQVDAYLRRIDLNPVAIRAKPCDLALLSELQLAHMLAVPFENSAIHMAQATLTSEGDDEPLVWRDGPGVACAVGDAFETIVTKRRGGYCFS